MEFIITCIDFFVHLDSHLNVLIQTFGVWTYVIVFLVIFCETGLVVTPILPGDSLLFGLGAVAAMGALEVEWLLLSLSVAAVVGNTVNYAVGQYIGPKIFQRENVRFLNKAYLERTHQFYEKHGGKTIVIARFLPIIRTFAPFVAGIGQMNYSHFFFYNLLGSVAWIFLFILGGYYFGNLPFIKSNFSLVIFSIIFISILPAIVGYLSHHFRSSQVKHI